MEKGGVESHDELGVINDVNVDDCIDKASTWKSKNRESSQVEKVHG